MPMSEDKAADQMCETIRAAVFKAVREDGVPVEQAHGEAVTTVDEAIADTKDPRIAG